MLKIILIAAGIILIIGLALFGTSIKEQALRGMAKETPGYNCGKGEVCTSCIINGNRCNCGVDFCLCGNETIDRAECELK